MEMSSFAFLLFVAYTSGVSACTSMAMRTDEILAANSTQVANVSLSLTGGDWSQNYTTGECYAHGNCFGTGSALGHYGNDERCTFITGVPAVLTVRRFDVLHYDCLGVGSPRTW